MAKPITKEKIMEHEFNAAAQWVCTAELHLAKNSDFEERWATTIAEKTGFWSGEPGLSKERWRLWNERFLSISKRDDLPQIVKDAASTAATIIFILDGMELVPANIWLSRKKLR